VLAALRPLTPALLLAALAATTAPAQTAPDTLFDYRSEMIPMRDGIQLHTVIVRPRGRSGDLPIILQRTPYGTPGPGLVTGPVPAPYRELVADGYVFAFQDIRGRGESQGTFVMNRPFESLTRPGAVDEATDAWDTVEWLTHNVPGTNGRVGVMGVSYPGWLAEAVLIAPHPAVKAISPQAPMTDTWMGDDFFHQGAFRMSYGFEYGWGMESRMVGLPWLPIDRHDVYDWYLRFPTLRALTEATGADRLPTWRRFMEHPTYDSVWQARAFQRTVSRLGVPTMTVGGWWDQEDRYGPIGTHTALERFDTANANVLVMGPWNHGGWNGPGDALGNPRFGQATGDTFRLRIQAPWFRYWLKGEGDGRFPDAILYDAGARTWRRFDRWPAADAVLRRLYFHANGRLSFEAPTEPRGDDAFVSDPAHPVPYRPRPIEVTYSRGSRWGRWMTEDQRFVHGRPDVLAWETAALAEDVTVAGDVIARLFASTTGSDADWAVKLIDVFPDSVGDEVPSGGYQLMVAGEILRGRYRRSFERPSAVRPGVVEPYAVNLWQQAYTFRRGHRIMVQVQSTWFPLYDRNPQTFVPDPFDAPASAYRAQTHRVWRTARWPSHVELHVLQGSPTP
jgi:putative CocE/NonD family hydrolase